MDRLGISLQRYPQDDYRTAQFRHHQQYPIRRSQSIFIDTIEAMSPTLPPSAALPPLKRLSNYSSVELAPLLKFLRTLYEAPVAGSKPAQDSGYASEASDDEDSSPAVKRGDPLETLRADRFEKSVAMKWLVGLVARGEEWVEEVPEDDAEYTSRSQTIEEAASLLSAISGIVTGALMRTFQFPHADKSVEPISIHLRDASILSQDHTSVGLQTWGSSCILGQRMVRSPDIYGLQRSSPESGAGPLRVLELGAGTGLMSMVISKLLKQDARVIATDFHPAVLENLRSNIAGNFPGEGAFPPEVLPLDWRHLHSIATGDCSDTLEDPFNEPFDHIIGADIIYEVAHVAWIKSSVELLLKPEGTFHLIMPIRPTHEAESVLVPEMFPTAEEAQAKRAGDTAAGKPELAVLNRQSIDRIAGTGRFDELQYYLYRIGWV